MRRGVAALAAVAAGAVVLAGCAGGDTGATAGTAATDGTATTADAASPEPQVTLITQTPEAPVDNAFAFTAPTVDGGTFDGASIDDADVVLWFWAPWCPTCQLQSKTINEALPRIPGGVQFIGVAGLSEDLAYMQEFVETTGTGGMTHIADLDGNVYRHFDITAQSTLVFIDDSGEASLLGSGATADEIVAKAEELAAG